MADMQEFAAFWLAEGKDGKKFMNGKGKDGKKYLMFKNAFKKEGDKTPDYKMFLVPEEAAKPPTPETAPPPNFDDLPF